MKRKSMPAVRHLDAAERIRLDNARLTAENALLVKTKELRGANLRNSLTSLMSGLVFQQDNITSFLPALRSNIYAPLTLNWTLLTYLYKTHGIIQTVIEVPVLDAFRKGLIYKSKELDTEDINEFSRNMKLTKAIHALTEAKIWARLYGGAGIIINTPQPADEPLDRKKMQGQPVEFYAANRWELNAPNRFSEHYDFYGKRIHASRVITISGKTAPPIIRFQLQGWGMSEIERMLEPFNLYLRTMNVIYALLEEAKVDVFKMKGFNSQLMTATGTEMVQKRIELAQQGKSYNTGLMLDSEDEYDQKQVTFSGLAEVMKQAQMVLAASLRMPLTKVFGISASGFNSGEDDIENYNAMVESEIREPAGDPVRDVIDIMSWVTFGDTFDIEHEYHPLRVLGAVEEEEVKTSKQNRFLAQYDRQLLTSKEFGEVSQKEDLIPIETEAAKGNLEDHPMPMAGTEGGEADDGDGAGGDKGGKGKPPKEKAPKEEAE